MNGRSTLCPNCGALTLWPDTPCPEPTEAVERVFEVIWPLAEWNGDELEAREAAEAVVAALKSMESSNAR